MIDRNASMAGGPYTEPLPDEVPDFAASTSGRNDALQCSMRNRFIERGKIEMRDPLITGLEVPLKSRLELVIRHSPILQEEDRLPFRCETVAENGAAFNGPSTFEQLVGNLIGYSLQNDLVV